MMRSVDDRVTVGGMGGSGQEGTRVFISRCIPCHDANSESHAPLPEALDAISPLAGILKALRRDR